MHRWIIPLFILSSAFTATGEHTETPNSLLKFEGTWSCVYISSFDPDRYAPRSKLWTITEAGKAVASGVYPADHSTGIQGKYRSESEITVDANTYTQTLIEYEMINPVHQGSPLTAKQKSAFEQQVKSGNPVTSNYEWINANSFRAISPYTDTLCERALEANS